MEEFEVSQFGSFLVHGSSNTALEVTMALDGLKFPSQKAKDPVGKVDADLVKEAEAGADGLEEDRSLCS